MADCFQVEKFPLPSSSELWDARNAEEWLLAKQYSMPQTSVTFGSALRILVDGKSAAMGSALQLSAYARFILLQALIHRTLTLRQLQVSSDDPLEPDQIKHLESALRRWQATWTSHSDHALDPLNPEGPLPFNSAAFLSLAYSRLHLNLAQHRHLESRDPDEVARSLMASPMPQRSAELTTTLLHATHQLSLPIHIGIEYVCRSQMLFWSCQHAFCALEPAVLLWKWLQVVDGREDLSIKETRIIAWIRTLIVEALQTVEPAELALHDGVNVQQLPTTALGVAILKIWAKTFSGNNMWPIIELVAKSLGRLADIGMLSSLSLTAQ